MREILFRAKRMDNGEWVEGNLIVDPKGFCYIARTHNIFDFEPIIFVDKDTVCQYTGLTDKNGTKIFEGDIHEYQNRFFIVRHGEYRDYETLEDVYGWHFEFTHSRDCGGFGGNEKEYVNIIGNIIDNKDLIKE